SYSIREIKQMFGLGERTIRRWTETGIILGTPVGETGDYNYDFQALTLFRRETAGVQVSRLLTPFEEALVLHEQGDINAAEFYEQAISEGDNIAEAYCNLGIIELDRGDMVRALENFAQSLKNDPRHVEAHYNLANLYYDAGDFPLARLHYEAAIQIEPNFSLVYYNLAL